MKVLVLLFIGAVPLLVATPTKFLAMESIAGDTQGVAAIDVGLLRQRVNDQTVGLKNLVDVNQQSIIDLKGVDFLSTEPLPDSVSEVSIDSQAARDWTEAITRGWLSIRDAHIGVGQFVSVYRRTFDDFPSEYDALAKFSQTDLVDNPLRAVAGGRELMRQVDAHRTRLAVQIEVAEDLQAAKLKCDQDSYRECLNILQRIDRSQLSPDALAEVAELERRSRFGDYWQNQPDAVPVTSATLDQRLAFLQKSPAAMTASEEAQIERFRMALEADECQLKMAELRELDTTDVAMYLATATSTATCEVNRKAVSEALRQWVAKSLVVSQIPTSMPPILETRRNNGEFLAGVFDRGAGQANYYWYYDTLARKRENKRWNEQLYVKTSQNRGNIVDHPQTPFPIRSALAFNKQRDELLSHIESELAWNQMSDLCWQLNRELSVYRQGQPSGWDEYERALGERLPELQFDECAKFVDEILDNWDTVTELLVDEAND